MDNCDFVKILSTLRKLNSDLHSLSIDQLKELEKYLNNSLSATRNLIEIIEENDDFFSKMQG